MVRPRLAFASAPFAFALLLGGCFDFDSLKPSGDGSVPEAGDDAPPGDAPTEECVEAKCALGCGTEGRCKTFVPKWWDEADARKIPEATEASDDLIIPEGKHWLIWTRGAGQDPVAYESDSALPIDLSVNNTFPNAFDNGAEKELPWSVIRVGPSGKRRDAVVLWVRDFKVESGATLHAVDGRPLVIAASRDIEVNGAVDVGAWIAPWIAGAGAFDSSGAACAGANGGETSGEDVFAGEFGFGGGGGSYATAGAAGGAHGDGEGGAAGAPVDALGSFGGGCAGGGGGMLTTASFVRPGQGGGAVALVALRSIVVGAAGTVSAGGAGGVAGANYNPDAIGVMSGGGGGGSGGLVWLEAPSVLIDGVVAANGGGGGQGSPCALWVPGDCIGESGTRGTATPSASGGNNAFGPNLMSFGGDGSNAAGVAVAGDGKRTGDSANTAGSGGGGGAGFVLVRHGPGANGYNVVGNIYPTVGDTLPIVEVITEPID